MIRQMAFAIAEAQFKLDESSIEVAEMMGGLKTVYNEEGEASFDDSRVFFGYDYMTIKEAEAYLSVDDAISGGDLSKALKNLKDMNNVPNNAPDTTEIKVPLRVSMLELGFAPTFYQFVDTIIEVKIAIKITRSYESTKRTSDRVQDTKKNNSTNTSRRLGGFFGLMTTGTGSNTSSSESVSTSQVDASYSAKYSYSAEGASLLRTKLSPLPPPPILEERIRDLMQMENERRAAKAAAKLPAPAPTPTP
ncbi:MAG: hypothetical protein HC843_11495 [Sphingomonadales bacterium]|nr:hypothetical protein [Sphingomonadales bacterium]